MIKRQQRIGAIEIVRLLPPDLDQALATLSEAESLLRNYVFADRLCDDGNKDSSASLSRVRSAAGR
jgi:hypothetical protein